MNVNIFKMSKLSHSSSFLKITTTKKWSEVVEWLVVYLLIFVLKSQVVYIKKKNHPRCAVGHISLMENNNRHAVFKPRDKRIPDITIELKKCPRGVFLLYMC